MTMDALAICRQAGKNGARLAKAMLRRARRPVAKPDSGVNIFLDVAPDMRFLNCRKEYIFLE